MATRAPALPPYKAVDGEIKGSNPIWQVAGFFQKPQRAKRAATQGDCICIFCKSRVGDGGDGEGKTWIRAFLSNKEDGSGSHYAPNASERRPGSRR